MTRDEILRWYAEVIATQPKEGFISASGLSPPAAAWVHQAALVVAASLPGSHRLAKAMEEPAPLPGPNGIRLFENYFFRIHAALTTAKKIYEEGKVDDFAAIVRAEAETEVLEAAEELLRNGYVAAATVLIGGALEVHVRELFRKQPGAVAFSGSPSIEKYDNAINAARNGGHPTAYDAAKSKDVKAWAAKRNDAAHDPVAFKRPEAEIRLMLDGVRLFVTTSR